MQPQLIIFDCDGVLVDSEIIAARVEAAMISEAGFAITPEEMMERYSGLTSKDILLRIEAAAGMQCLAECQHLAPQQTDDHDDRMFRGVTLARVGLDPTVRDA